MQQLRHERQQGVETVKLDSLSGDDMFNLTCEMPPLDISMHIKLDYKGSGHGQGTKLLVYGCHCSSVGAVRGDSIGVRRF